MKSPLRSFVIVLSICSVANLLAQTASSTLQDKISSMVNGYQATVGVSVTTPDGKELVTIRSDEHFAMQSVYKFHLALAILHLADEGKLQLDQKVTIKRSDIDSETHSPMRDAHPAQDITTTIKELLRYSVSLSDNNACDVLFKLAGGTKEVDQYIHSLGVKEVAIAATEREMKQGWEVQFTNWSTPKAATTLLNNYLNASILKKSSHDLLWQLMTSSVKSDRLAGQLPANTVVAHKAGTSSRNKEGVRAANNDIGIVVLPDGAHFSIAVFINNSKESDEVNTRIIASVSKACYDHFTGKQ